MKALLSFCICCQKKGSIIGGKPCPDILDWNYCKSTEITEKDKMNKPILVLIFVRVGLLLHETIPNLNRTEQSEFLIIHAMSSARPRVEHAMSFCPFSASIQCRGMGGGAERGRRQGGSYGRIFRNQSGKAYIITPVQNLLAITLSHGPS